MPRCNVAEHGAALDEQRLLQFIRTELLDGRTIPIDADTYLFGDGMIDSLKILRLIAFVELRLGRRLADREIVMPNFRSVRAITSRFGS
jgi:acyl carrier protein